MCNSILTINRVLNSLVYEQFGIIVYGANTTRNKKRLVVSNGKPHNGKNSSHVRVVSKNGFVLEECLKYTNLQPEISTNTLVCSISKNMGNPK